ncbi:hypothetical protein ACU8KH_03932 [Lachancea thermotolerans]
MNGDVEESDWLPGKTVPRTSCSIVFQGFKLMQKRGDQKSESSKIGAKKVKGKHGCPESESSPPAIDDENIPNRGAAKKKGILVPPGNLHLLGDISGPLRGIAMVLCVLLLARTGSTTVAAEHRQPKKCGLNIQLSCGS